MSGDIKLSIRSDLVRSLGCDALRIGKKFALLLGSNLNMLSFSIPDPFALLPVKLQTIAGFVILFGQNPICDFSGDLILCSQPIGMDQHLIKNVKSPVNKFDAVNNAYVDRIKYKTATGTIPNTVRTDHTLFTFPAPKSVLNGGIIICGMWVERLTDGWVATLSPMFATAWPGFHKFSRGPTIMTFFSGSLLVVGNGISR